MTLTAAQWRVLRELYGLAPHVAVRSYLRRAAPSTLRVLERMGYVASWDVDFPGACYSRVVTITREGAQMVEAYFPEEPRRFWNLPDLVPTQAEAEASS